MQLVNVYSVVYAVEYLDKSDPENPVSKGYGDHQTIKVAAIDSEGALQFAGKHALDAHLGADGVRFFGAPVLALGDVLLPEIDAAAPAAEEPVSVRLSVKPKLVKKPKEPASE